jgi:tetratricopeptide (TPR) repeat protein
VAKRWRAFNQKKTKSISIKKMKKILFLIIICQLSCKSQTDCPEGINLLPMYGEVKKCEQQIELDNEFILESEKQFKNRKEASEYYVSKGWEYFYKDDNDTSMKRFNQAWLLDNTNSQIYWGFGNLLGRKKEFEKSIKYLQKSLELEPNNAKVYECISTSYGQLYLKTKDIKYLDLRINNLNKALKIEPNNGRTLGELASSYSYLMQKDSLIKYIKKTDEIDSKFINPKVREIAEKK